MFVQLMELKEEVRRVREENKVLLGLLEGHQKEKEL
jgi:hypothetical protein